MSHLMNPYVQIPATVRRPWPLWRVALVLFLISLFITPTAVAADDHAQQDLNELADLSTLERAFQRVVDRVAPSVVGIRAIRRHIAALPGISSDTAESVARRVIVNGSGTIIDADGLILTNEHVIQSANEIEIHFHDGSVAQATVMAADPRADLAVLRVPRANLQPARFCRWGNIARGQWAVVIGNPFGLGLDGQLSVSVGVISNLGRQLPGLGEVDDRFYNDMIQLTAPINPGNSGGPVFNIRGEVIGVITAMHTRAPADEGIGFAIPLTPAKRRVIDTLRRGREVEYGYLGITVRVPRSIEREQWGDLDGVVVQQVEPLGPAARAGVRVGDVIRRFQNETVEGPSHLAELAGQSPVGAQVRLELLRDGASETIHMVVAQREVSRVSWMRGGAIVWRGMRLDDLSRDMRRRLHISDDVRGIIVTEVHDDSPASLARINVGDIIVKVDGRPIHDSLEFLLRTRAVEGPLDVMIWQRGKRTIMP